MTVLCSDVCCQTVSKSNAPSQSGRKGEGREKEEGGGGVERERAGERRGGLSCRGPLVRQLPV